MGELCHTARPQIKENKMKEILGPCRRTKKAVEREHECDTYYNWHTRNDPQKLEKGAGRVRKRRTILFGSLRFLHILNI